MKLRHKKDRRKGRFIVDSVHGFPVNINAIPNSGHERTFWYVLDSQVCYRIMREFMGQNAEERARVLAEGLNAEHENHLWEIGWSG